MIVPFHDDYLSAAFTLATDRGQLWPRLRTFADLTPYDFPAALSRDVHSAAVWLAEGSFCGFGSLYAVTEAQIGWVEALFTSSAGDRRSPELLSFVIETFAVPLALRRVFCESPATVGPPPSTFTADLDVSIPDALYLNGKYEALNIFRYEL